MELDPELIDAARGECFDRLEAIATGLGVLRRSPVDEAALPDLFRQVHTLKSTARMLGWPAAEALLHAMEEPLSAARLARAQLTEAAIVLLGEGCKRARALVESGGLDPDPVGGQKLIHDLRGLAEPGESRPAPRVSPLSPPTVVPRSSALRAQSASRAQERPAERSPTPLEVRSPPAVRVPQAALSELVRQVAETSPVDPALLGSVIAVATQPVATAWAHLATVAREAGEAVGASVGLTVRGDGVRLGHDVLALVRDPLIQLVRNAVVHGLERPDPRIALGKPAVGVVEVEVRLRDGFVQIEVRDDGRGVDLARVRAAAVAARLGSPDAVAALPDDEALQLILAPGLTTVATLSELAGRGVGLDVVASAVGRAGGRVEVASTPGRGASVRALVPLTVAVAPMLEVGLRGSVFGLPGDAVLEVLDLRDPAVAERLVSTSEGARLSWRDGVLPVGGLIAQVAPGEEDRWLVVVASGSSRAGLVVESVGGLGPALVVAGGPAASGRVVWSHGSCGVAVAVSERCTSLQRPSSPRRALRVEPPGSEPVLLGWESVVWVGERPDEAGPGRFLFRGDELMIVGRGDPSWRYAVVAEIEGARVALAASALPAVVDVDVVIGQDPGILARTADLSKEVRREVGAGARSGAPAGSASAA